MCCSSIYKVKQTTNQIPLFIMQLDGPQIHQLSKFLKVQAILKNKVALFIIPKQSKPNNSLVNMTATMETENKVVQEQ
jgi:hypothetical protein